jgi:taurine dioxygenase
MQMKIKPITGVIGAEVEGFDLTSPMSKADNATLRTALSKYQVLVFRDQPITPQQQHDFGASFGPITVPKVDSGGLSAPGITVIEAEYATSMKPEWHADHSFSEKPPMAAMLHAVTLPPKGGDTVWINTAAAYEALSAPMRTMLDGLTAQHDTQRMLRRMAASGKTFNLKMDHVPVHHPVVRVHSDNGRKGLYVNPLYTSRINELGEAESDAMLQFLYEFMKNPEFQLRVRWSPHTTVIWDEELTIHSAIADYKEPRMMHRLMIDGSKPIGTRTFRQAA